MLDKRLQSALPPGHSARETARVDDCVSYTLYGPDGAITGELVPCDGSRHGHDDIAADMPMLAGIEFVYMRVIASRVRSIAFAEIAPSQQAAALAEAERQLSASGWQLSSTNPGAHSHVYERAGFERSLAAVHGSVMCLEMPKRP